MAKEPSLCLLFLSFLLFCSSGTTASSSSAATTFFQKSKISKSEIRFSVSDYKFLSTLTNTNLSVDFFLNESLVENFVSSKSKSSLVSWLETRLLNIFPQVDIRSIVVRCGSECLRPDEMPLLIPVLKSIHSFLSNLQLSRETKVSVAFPLSFLENLNASYESDLLRIVMFLNKIDSFVLIEDIIDGESSTFQSVIERATLAAAILPCKDVPVVFTIKSHDIPSSMELAQFTEAVSKYLEAVSHFTKRIVAFYAQVRTTNDFVLLKKEEGEEIFPLFLRENPSKVHIRRTLQDTTNSPTPPSPVITPPDTPTIITVPSTNPVTVSPTNPASTPVTVPSTTPIVPLAPTNPANPVTNPVTSSYPPPSSGSVPVTSALPPPPSTNAQAMPGGQSWCVAKTGVPQASLQSALDYACGMSGVDCSQIQQGGSCYNPNSLQNHASFAFNNYYQKNPAPTSCDFGGTATIVNTNPSSGSCIYPSSSGAGTSGSGTGSPVLGSQSPPDLNTSYSASLRPFLGCMVLAISLVTARLTA
ncbi:hypothetical protein JHK82_054429 [Glycine max]|uniref:X8 domain-containing protein n=1 Tax=Glycine max TaxID=3847 RepID=K7MZR5_SOYBN|nr:glucan endo-1,3-beta-glucosidase 1 [Glycine max]KAG4913842.1 hypothetical protein JHK86_054275 [Glycine max]KAG5087032.1 hypothetical protein JHK82_054429 [Glycine max]KRG96680.1 hypothetical protein GLYMA_19G225900v4 [Glycine max]|eukprot:XP_003553692.1 glucan endo-1,3-beta-glucosidase 1 [Glycine max]